MSDLSGGSLQPVHQNGEGGLDRRRVLQASGAVGLAAAALPVFRPHPAVARPAKEKIVPDDEALRMWYAAPGAESKVIEEGLPVGNGRVGGLVVGSPADTAFFLTDASVWSGVDNTTLDSAGQFPYARENFGTFQLLTRARLRLHGHTNAAISHYERALDLTNGVVVTTYRIGQVTYRQECFASYPDDVVVVRLSRSGRGSFAGSFTLEGTRGEAVTGNAKERTVSLVDDLDNGLKYAATAGVAVKQGEVDVDGGAVTFVDANEVVIVVSGGTNYKPDASVGYHDPLVDVAQVARGKLRRALRETGKRLLGTHVADYRRSAGAFALDLGRSTSEQRRLDTGARLARRETDAAPDPEFDAMYLEFSRYLTITGSRDGLPTNLQGLWIDNNTPDWMADYHNDINLQMNYWPTHRFGLAEHAEPLLDFCLAQLPAWSKQTTELFNDPRNRFRNSSGEVAGWTVAISTGIHGNNGWWWHPAGNAWLCLELWQHYEYTLDRTYLRRLMPLLRGTVEFWETRLIEKTIGSGADARTVLVGDKGWSPEHGPQDGVGNSYDQELCHAVFGYFMEASQILGRDRDLAKRAGEMRRRLYLPEVSPKTGWLQEWMSPDNLGDAQHRHLSHLIGWYPGDRIRYDNQSPAYVDGVRKVLEARGFESYGWACAWRAACWARLKDANRAYLTLGYVLRPAAGHLGGSGINLFDLYQTNRYIFQIDANYGVAAAMLEMLVHARPGVIDLMPAVPEAWADGSVRGMGVRGGFTLDMTWKDGVPKSVTLHSVAGTHTEVRVGDWKQTVTLKPGKSVTLRPRGVPYPPPPPPQPKPPASKIIHEASGRSASVYGGGTDAGAELSLWDYNGGTSMTWYVADSAEEHVTIECVRSEHVVAIPDGGGAGTVLVQGVRDGSAQQDWKLVDAGAGKVRIVNRGGLVIGTVDDGTTSGARLEAQTESDSPSQLWTVSPE